MEIWTSDKIQRPTEQKRKHYSIKKTKKLMIKLQILALKRSVFKDRFFPCLFVRFLKLLLLSKIIKRGIEIDMHLYFVEFGFA